MKLTKFYLVLQYFCLVGLSAITILIISVISDTVAIGIPFVFKVFAAVAIIVVTQLTLAVEIAIAVKAVRCFKSGNGEPAVKSWRLLKLATIPFYAFNLIMQIATAPLFFPLCLVVVPINLIFCEATRIVSGIIGINTVMYSRTGSVKISSAHFVLQLLPVADIISTAIISKKIRSTKQF